MANNLPKSCTNSTQAETKQSDVSAQDSYLVSTGQGHGSLSWDELLTARLVVLLGEPGSGKSSELKNRYRRARSSQQFAFFIELEQLVSRTVADVLSQEDRRHFLR